MARSPFNTAGVTLENGPVKFTSSHTSSAVSVNPRGLEEDLATAATCEPSIVSLATDPSQHRHHAVAVNRLSSHLALTVADGSGHTPPQVQLTESMH